MTKLAVIKYNLIRAFFILVFGVLYCLNANAQPTIINVDATTMKEAIEVDPEVIVLDVRMPVEVGNAKIPGSENIDIREDGFWMKFKALNKSKTYYVYCNTGGRSTSAARVMKQMGFNNVYNLTGGIEAWKSKGYLVE